MGTATTLSTPQDQVEALIRQVAAENDLELTDKLVDLEPTKAKVKATADQEREDMLERR